MPLLTIRDLSLAFGGPKLFDRAQIVVEQRERICLIGRNGEGKSTLLKVIAGQQEPDEAEFETTPNLRIAALSQEVPEDLPGTVFDVAVEGAGKATALLRDYHYASASLADPEADIDAALAQMSDLQHQLEAIGGWQIEAQVNAVIGKLALDPDAPFNTLSGGMKRRALLARALVTDPDILLLDEPTNHLDFESIVWLEDFLKSLHKAVIFITHDRAFLQAIATRIIELDRGKLRSFDCDYATYLLRKEALLEEETVQNAAFDKKLAKEETWIRQGIKARRTRNEGRVRALKTMRSERTQRRETRDGPAFQMQQANNSGAKVITAANLHFAWGNKKIVQDFTSTIWRKDKIGILGPNGSGKSTFLQLLLGKLPPDSGTITHGTQLEIAYFDQHREQLDPNHTVQHAAADGHEHVTFNGRKRHILSYLQEFLFGPQMCRQPVKSLSGGERNRLLLARLFAKPANLLVLDEPTNDLDIESLELLEDILIQYDGTLLVVSHDRQFLNNVVGYTYALEGNGEIIESVGGYDEYLRDKLAYQNKGREQKTEGAEQKMEGGKRKAESGKNNPRRRNNREKRELAEIPLQIDTLETRQAQLNQLLADPDFYTNPANNPAQLTTELKQIEAKLDHLLERWQELEAIPE